MEIFNQELAIKVFDYFFLKKHKVKGFIIFNREVYHRFTDDSKNAFGIDVIIGDNESDLPNNRFKEVYNMFEIFDDNGILDMQVSKFHLLEQNPDQVKFMIQNHLKEIASDQFPDFLKVLIVKSSVDCHRTLTGVKFLSYEGIIPKASSLEELAIKMELES